MHQKNHNHPEIINQIRKIIHKHLKIKTMKKTLLAFAIVLAVVSFAKAQVVTDFEVIKMNLMLGGVEDLSSMTVVPNPDPTGINTSSWVVKYVRDKDGVPWGGFWSALPLPVDVTVNKYAHVKVWKPRISPIKFKIEGGAAGNLETFSISPQATTGAWEDIVFDFTSKTGPYPTISFMPDFEDPLTLTDDIVIYFDDIMFNNDPTPNSAVVDMVEDYEIIPLNLMLGDPLVDSSKMTLVPNPDPTGLNTSNWVVQYLRDKDGVPWGGFWSPTGVDVTSNQYMHVKVWKPRISPIKFKIEGGAAGNLETLSNGPQNTTDAWEDMVFDFTSKTGAYPTISFMPDFEDPLTLTADMIMYFDDIILNNDPNPMVGIGSIKKTNDVSVYPVPFSSYLVVNTGIDLSSVAITSSLGQKVITLDNLSTGSTTINTSSLSAGLYIVTIYPKSGNSFTLKAMKN
jgi:hypothetical protein